MQRKNCPGCGAIIHYGELCWRCKEAQTHGPIMGMSSEEIARRAAIILQNPQALDSGLATLTGENWPLENFTWLFAYQNFNTAELARLACEKGIYSPAEIYRDAGPGVRDKLIHELKKPNCETPRQLLAALALIGDDEVLRVFMELEQSPLPWQEKYNAYPRVFAERGGWCFDADGQRQTLVFATCYAMTHSSAGKLDKTVQIGKKHTGHCKTCGCRMIDILVLDGRNERLAFLGIDGLLRVPICPWCAGVNEETVIRYMLDGTSSYKATEDPLFTVNQIPQEYIDEIDENTWVLDSLASPLYLTYGFCPAPTIGGMPQKIQHWAHMACPDCGKKMKSLASIPWVCLSDYFEGELYIEICTGCQVVKVQHQQS